MNVKDRLGFKSLESEKKLSRDHLIEGYTWVPPGISSHKVSYDSLLLLIYIFRYLFIVFYFFD